MTDFLTWKECYNRWLRMLYYNFILCCYKHKTCTNIKWKHSLTYAMFCEMMYHASSKEILPEDLLDESYEI